MNNILTSISIAVLYSSVAMILMGILYTIITSIIENNIEVQKWINYIVGTEIYPIKNNEERR